MSTTANNTPLQAFMGYSFDSDGAYQQGLAGIVNSSAFQEKPKEEQEEVLLRSRIFYFQKITGHVVDLEDVKNYQTSLNGGSDSGSGPSVTSSEEPATLTFAQLKELIEQGKTDQIPNNRTIPNELHTEAPSVSAAPVRPKPWEVRAQQSVTAEAE